MFFNDDELGPLKKRTILRVPPPIPDNGWRPPQYFPNLSSAAVIGFDLERKENDWQHGPGWRRGKAHTVGFSVAARDRQGNGGKWYFPIQHEVEPQWNLDRKQCLSWFKSVLETPHIPKVGANLIYDVGSLTDDQIYVQGELHDCQFAEALLQSDGLVNLDHLGEKYLGEGKETNELYQWLSEAYGGPATQVQRENIWRAPPRLAGPYGEQDADLPIRVLEKQWPLLRAQDLLGVYRMECDLIRLLVRMRLAGVTVNIAAAEKLYDELAVDIANLYRELYIHVPIKIEGVNSPRDVAAIFDYVGIEYPRTESGNPSFRKDWMKNLEHPIADLVNKIREYEKVRGTFIRGYLLEGHINGKIHCNFHPLQGDDTGAKTGRFSSDCPNLQNIPVRTKLGKRIRACFIPDIGHVAWEKDDASQIEYRELAHYAVDDGDGSADRLREAYNLDPKTNYHHRTRANVKELTGMDIEHRPIKNMNFGLVYGMSEKKLIRQNGFTPDQGTKVFKAYHQGNPYVRPTMKAAANEMQMLGYITTVLGRRTRFNLWEPRFQDYGKPRAIAIPYETAIRMWGHNIIRAGEHKAINYRLQGSAADSIKAGMVKADKAGIFDVIGVPRLQVHDELDFSVIDESPIANEAYSEMRHLLETSIKLRVPVIYEYDRAPSWGEIPD